jgi:hypothetical protein
MTQITSVRDQIRNVVANASRFFGDLTGANDPASLSAARVLIRSIRKQLARKAMVTRKTFGGEQQRSERSSPGEAPRQVTGRLRRSVASEVVGGVRRVGPASFRGRLLEEGVDSTAAVTPSGREVGTERKARGTQSVRSLRRRKGGKANRVLRIAPRPFMQKALEDALPKMEGEAVSALQARERTLRSYT